MRKPFKPLEFYAMILLMKITKEHSEKIESLISKKTFTLQDVVSLLDNLYTENQIRYHINKYYPESKGNLVKEYSKGGTKLEYILKEIFPYDKIEKEFPLGERLRVDFVITAPYNLAFEFDGIQHDEYSSFFHGSKGEFIESQQRDSRKEHLLQNRGIKLIRLSSLQMDETSIQALVAQVGYGDGQIIDQSLLTTKEKQAIKQAKFQQLKKELATKALDKPKLKSQKSDSTNAYKESLKEKQRLFRKEQYQKQKEWLKQNKKK
jgi:hypothetical protein